MQVDTNPRQMNAVDCGIFCGLQYETFCLHAQRPFKVLPKHRGRRAVVCKGEDPEFLMKSESWFNIADVSLTRTYYRAAAIAYWRLESGVQCRVLNAHWMEARATLERSMIDEMPDETSMW